ncbi:hypothetical protein COCON_G00085040 [Conger conger]|uniref:Uncharacterized protein n=1 Tax=Conger conger TaxID=82655 RepID=A0A9Q1DQB6_CONCO|nr:hypothetical protein COCON_G00085040 [Conger conger]
MREQTASKGDSCKRHGTDLALFENRSEVKNWTDNRFELRISPLLWEDHGHYRCVLCKNRRIDKTCTYEIITVDVYQEPAELMEGENGSVVCNVSQAKEGTRLLWIEVESQQKFASADGFGIEFDLSVINVTLKRSAWVCAVFLKDYLRALLPLNLTIKRQATQTTQPTQPYQPTGLSAGGMGRTVTYQPETTGIIPCYLFPACFTGLLLCLATVLIIYTKVKHRRHQVCLCMCGMYQGRHGWCSG